MAKETRVPKSVLLQLKRIRQVATMERFGAGFNAECTTEQLREGTRIYRETWLIDPIDQLIAWAEGETVVLTHQN